ncbi:type II toxin-antitoxin system RelE/ParE family toxin [Pseudomonas fluorescens]|uniref:type II toxin-antitoxin system RelE/ParE family toxin n=1 Tax=Pseudomonas fluorescens TaxID=294 RepID=UPI002883367C|nr:type II toxin-antitoxin system RelE/ParE family toxin [Pseudomonas fluorescens]
MDALPLEWSDQALDDLADIIDYIEQHNSNAAAALQHKVGAATQRLSSIPYGYRSGRVPSTREMVVNSNYLLIYQVNGRIKILTLVHTRQQYPRTS